MPWLIRTFKWLIRPRWISLNVSSIRVEETKTYQLVATITPDWVKNPNIKRESNDTTIATVSDNWLVTAKKEWNCAIKVITEDRWLTYECSCEVYIIPVASITLDQNFCWSWILKDSTINSYDKS